MNNLDEQYITLLQDIIDNGVEKKDRTGTGTKSVFGRQIRHKMSEGFPLLTTKKMPFKTIATELLWFLNGDTNIKYLVNNGCNIWNGDAYKKYATEMERGKHGAWLDEKEFINEIKNDGEFAKKWGELGPIYGKQWRAWGGYIKTPKFGWIKRGDDGVWVMYWSDVSGMDDCCYTPIKNHVHLTDEDIDTRVEFEFEADYADDFNPLKFAIITEPKTRVEYVNHVDQIANLIEQLKTNPDSRRLMVSAWNVGEIDGMTLPPCHYGFQLYTTELSEEERYTHLRTYKYSGKWRGIGDPMEYYDSINVPKRKISLMWNQRSVDTFLGLPFNIASYGLLLEIIAKEVNMVPDELIGNLGDTHLYSNHIDQAIEQIGSELSDKQLNKIFKELDAESFEAFVTAKRLKTQAVKDKDYEEAGKQRDVERLAKLELAKLELPIHDRQPFDLPTLKIKGWTDNGMIKPMLLPENGDEEFYDVTDFTLSNYKSHPSIKAPLSN
tara:strand:- start:16322 stop:17803 length:1482 start_codon:yes stop_codon:yes gene_type:complete